MDIQINILELAAELAHSRTLYESSDICDNEGDMYDDLTADTLIYTEEIQNRFNDWYDFYYAEIAKCSKTPLH